LSQKPTVEESELHQRLTFGEDAFQKRCLSSLRKRRASGDADAESADTLGDFYQCGRSHGLCVAIDERSDSRSHLASPEFSIPQLRWVNDLQRQKPLFQNARRTVDDSDRHDEDDACPIERRDSRRADGGRHDLVVGNRRRCGTGFCCHDPFRLDAGRAFKVELGCDAAPPV